MDSNFREWLSLHVGDATASRYAATVSANLDLFPAGASEDTLLEKLQTYAYTAAPVATLMMLAGETQRMDDPGDQTLAIGTVYTVVNGMSWYARFRGCTYNDVRTFAKRVSYCTRHTAQSRLLGSCVYTPVLLSVHARLCEVLRTARSVIDRRIARFLSHRSLAENEHSLRAFGLDHLRPFLELELRAEYVPLTIQQVQALQRPLAHGPPSQANSQCQLRYTEDRSAIVLLVPVGRAGVPGTGTRYTKAVPVTLSRRCSVYLWFYMAYCATTTRHGTRLFHGANGGTWLQPLRDVERYVRDVERYVRDVGPCTHHDIARSTGLEGTNRRDYVQVMRRVWLAARVAQHHRLADGRVDVTRVVADALLAHMGVGVEHEKYQRMFQYLRDTENAVSLLAALPHNLHTPRATDPEPPMPDDPGWLPVLAREMMAGTRVLDTPVYTGTRAVDRVQSLYSREYTESVPGRYLSVWEYRRRHR